MATYSQLSTTTFDGSPAYVLAQEIWRDSSLASSHADFLPKVSAGGTPSHTDYTCPAGKQARVGIVVAHYGEGTRVSSYGIDVGVITYRAFRVWDASESWNITWRSVTEDANSTNHTHINYPDSIEAHTYGYYIDNSIPGSGSNWPSSKGLLSGVTGTHGIWNSHGIAELDILEEGEKISWAYYVDRDWYKDQGGETHPTQKLYARIYELDIR